MVQNPGKASPGRAASSRVPFVALGILLLVVMFIAAWVFLVPHREAPQPAGPPIAGPTARMVAPGSPASVESLLRQRRFPEAIALMERHLESHPEDLAVRTTLMETYLRDPSSEPAKVETSADAILTVEPRHALANCVKGELMRLRGDAGYAEYLRQAAAASGASPDILARVGGSFLLAERLDEAAAYLDHALSRNPNHAAALAARAEVYRRLQEYDRQLVVLERLVSVEPQNYLRQEELGRVRLAAGNLEGAESALLASVRAANERGRPPTGTCALSLSDVSRMRALQASFPAERERLARQALGWAEQGIAFGGTAFGGHVRAALALGVLGDRESLQAAERHLEEAARLEPGDPRVASMQADLAAALRPGQASPEPAWPAALEPLPSPGVPDLLTPSSRPAGQGLNLRFGLP